MRVTGCDERDSSWEFYEPRFRVYFFAGDGPPLATQTHDVTDADALEVLAWAQEQAGDRLVAVALVEEASPWGAAERGLVWLVGMDANSQPADDSERHCQALMRQRRGRQVVLEEAPST